MEPYTINQREYISYATIMNKNAKNINKILKSQADITSNTHEQEQAAKSYG